MTSGSDMQDTNQLIALANYVQAVEVARILGRDDVDDNNAIALYQQRYPAVANQQPGKIAVYTAIFGGYDGAPVLNHIDPTIDYILFTEEADFAAPAPWQVRVVPAIFEDPQMDARRLKLLSHLFLYDYDVTVWIDGNFTLEAVTADLIAEMVVRAPVSLCKHQFRNCIYDEAGEIIRRGIDALTPVLRQVQYYQVRKFPSQYGLHVTSFLVRDHRDANTVKLNMRWWELLSANSKRDQLAFDYVRWECNIPILELPFNLKNNTLYCWGQNGEGKHQHRVRRNDERFGRAFNLNGLTPSAPYQGAYHASSEIWSRDFLKHWFALNHLLSSTTGPVEPSVLNIDTQHLSPYMLPDVRMAEYQKHTLNLLDHAKRILMLGFDGGHFALMALRLTSAKCVLVEEQLTPYKVKGIEYLQALHGNRFAHFALADIQKLDTPMFDTVFVCTGLARNPDELLNQVRNQVSDTTKIIKMGSDIPVFFNTEVKYTNHGDYTKSIYGVLLKNRPDDLTWRFAIQGKYGQFYSEHIKKLGPSIFIDIGANIGLYSLIAAVNPNIQTIYSFEPNPETFNYLAANLELNQVSNCKAYPLAISDKCEKQKIHTKSNHSGVATLRTVDESEGYEASFSIECIDAKKLDELFTNPNNLPISIKIDVEGFELIVIKTLINTKLWAQVTEIYYEVDESYLDYQQVERLLINEGFKVIGKNGDGKHYDLLVKRA